MLYVVPHTAEADEIIDALGPGAKHVIRVPAGSGAALSRVQAELGANPGAINSVCLVGSWSTLPPSAVEDPVSGGGGADDFVYTDNFFGRDSIPSAEEMAHGDVLPDVPVSRIPMDAPEQVAALVSRRPLARQGSQSLAISTDRWKGASAEVAGRIGHRGRMWLSPPFVESVAPEAFFGEPSRLYFNLHGAATETPWYGDFMAMHQPTALRPEQVRVSEGAVVVSEACYGAAQFEGELSMSDAFLQGGAASFVGSTVIAYGPAEPPVGMADLVALYFYEEIDSGVAAGPALLAAKHSILEQCLERDARLEDVYTKTLLSFVHYGHPLASTGVRKGRAPLVRLAGCSSAPHAVPQRPGSTLAAIRSGMRNGGSSALGQARSRLQSRMSDGDWSVLSSGRVELSRLPPEFRSAREILEALADGATPIATYLKQYRSGRGCQAVLTQDTEHQGRRFTAGVLLGEDGRILEKFVSKGEARAFVRGCGVKQ